MKQKKCSSRVKCLWLTVACRTGIIYAAKSLLRAESPSRELRAESPRDYIDILRSMKFRPNVLYCDMAHIAAYHGNRTGSEFSSHLMGAWLKAPLKISDVLLLVR